MGIMMQQGQDPVDILRKTAMIIQKREKGESFHEAVLDAFAPPPPQQPPEGASIPGEAPLPAPGSESASSGGLPPGMQGSGLPFGVAPGQAEAGPGGRPDMQTLLASLGNNGQPNISAGVARRLPA